MMWWNIRKHLFICHYFSHMGYGETSCLEHK
nr:MAG TPA: hypothetical protein [Caudoviricetes sp.]